MENNIFLYIFISVTDHVIIHVYNECDAQDDTVKVWFYSTVLTINKNWLLTNDFNYANSIET